MTSAPSSTFKMSLNADYKPGLVLPHISVWLIPAGTFQNIVGSLPQREETVIRYWWNAFKLKGQQRLKSGPEVFKLKQLDVLFRLK